MGIYLSEIAGNRGKKLIELFKVPTSKMCQDHQVEIPDTQPEFALGFQANTIQVCDKEVVYRFWLAVLAALLKALNFA